MSNEEIRTHFESWAVFKLYDITPDDNGGYTSIHTDCAWSGYKNGYLLGRAVGYETL